MFKTISTKLANLRARFIAWRAARTARKAGARHATSIDEVGTKRVAKKIERTIKKVAITTVALGLGTVLVMFPQAFMGLVIVGLHVYLLAYLAIFFNEFLNAVV